MTYNNTKLNYIVLICAQRMLYDSMVSKGNTGHAGIEKATGPTLYRATALQRANTTFHLKMKKQKVPPVHIRENYPLGIKKLPFLSHLHTL